MNEQPSSNGTKILFSQIDDSVDFITPSDPHDPNEGFFESRYVRRTAGNVACYLSSQSGCAMRCSFCHLTATKQFVANNADAFDLHKQAATVLEYYAEKCEPAEYAHFNFMARGEPLMNPHVAHAWEEVYALLKEEADKYNLFPKFHLSTIMPKAMELPLKNIFYVNFPTVYYSLYSLNPEFRAKWLPNAMDPEQAFEQLAAYQRNSKTLIKLHWCYIAGQNDSLLDRLQIVDMVKKHKLQVSINIVRYNPFSPEYGKETVESLIENDMKQLSEALHCPIKVQTRVGPDVYASCGQFISKEEFNNGQ